MDYTGFLTDIATWTQESATDADWINSLPTIIELAEKRCYRDLDLLEANVTDSTGILAVNSRTFTLPTTYGRFLAVEQAAMILLTGDLAPLTPASTQFIDALWPANTAPTTTTVPAYFARLDDAALMVGPMLGSGLGSLTMQIRGTIRPAALSVGNPTTWLTLYAYDLFFAAAMLAASAYMRNFGAQSDNPAMAVSWDKEYSARLMAAKTEELRKKFMYIGTERD
jgi:hypothetical protein